MKCIPMRIANAVAKIADIVASMGNGLVDDSPIVS